MPTSLEDMTEQDRATYNLGKLVAAMMADPKLASQTKRLLKEKNPELRFPDIEAEDAVKAATTATNKRVEELEALLRKQEAVKALEAENQKIEAAGLEVKAVKEFMDKRGITDVDVVIELFESRQALAEPSSDTVSAFRFEGATPEDLKKMWNDPVKWREEKAYEVLRELRGKKGVRQAV